MNIGVIGVNHNSAPISVREKVSFTDTKKIEAINSLLDKDISEIVILSTCNRSEIYVRCENIQEKINLLANFYEDFFDEKEIKNYLFSKIGRDAVSHIFEVTAGLDSIVLGEDQILGQVKKHMNLLCNWVQVKRFLINFLERRLLLQKRLKRQQRFLNSHSLLVTLV